MIKSLFATLFLLVSFSTVAQPVKIDESSSWEEILNTQNIEVVGDEVWVGKHLTNMFSVEHKDGVLYTKNPTQNGYYDLRYATSNQGAPFIKTDKTIKSGSVIIQKGIYEYNKPTSNSGEQIFIGYKDYKQALTRNLRVYKARELGQTGNSTRTFLFEKEYTINEKM